MRGVYRTCNTDCDVIKKESRGKEEKNEEANNDARGRRRRGMLRHCHRASICPDQMELRIGGLMQEARSVYGLRRSKVGDVKESMG